MNCHYVAAFALGATILIAIPTCITSNKVYSEATNENLLTLTRNQQVHLQAIKRYFLKHFNRNNVGTDENMDSNGLGHSNGLKLSNKPWKNGNTNIDSDERTVYKLQESENIPPGVSSNQWVRSFQSYKYQCAFNVSRESPFCNSETEMLASANLQLRVSSMVQNLPGQKFPVKRHQINTYLVIGFRNDGQTNKTLLGSKVLSHGDTNMLQFDVREGVRYWCQNYLQFNLGVEIMIEYDPSTVDTTSVPFGNRDDSSVLLVVETTPRLRRRRQSTTGLNDEVCDFRSEVCCQFPITVRFTDIGLRWVVYPSEYTTHQCAGTCPHRYIDSLAINDLAVIRSKLHNMNSSVHPAPSCVPTKLSNLTILHTTETNPSTLDIKVLSDFVVDECKCA